jgi:phosphoglycolate phosphatase
MEGRCVTKPRICLATSGPGVIEWGMAGKGLIFDFDGTIIDSGPIFIACMNELGPEFGYDPVKAGGALREMSAHEVFTVRLGLSPGRLREWTAKFSGLLKVRMVFAPPFPGMKDALRALAAEWRIGILTSNSEEIVQSILGRHGFTPVDFVRSGVPILEKDRALGDLVQSRGLSPDRTIYVGDEVRDIDACRTVGIPVVSVTWGFNSRAALTRRGPDFLVDSPEELLHVLDSAIS